MRKIVIYLFACLFVSTNVVAKSEKFVMPTKEERIKICADVKAGKYEDVSMKTFEESGFDIKELEKHLKKINWIGELNSNIPSVVTADYNNDGKEETIILTEDFSAASTGCDMYYFMEYLTKEKRFLDIPDTWYTSPISCDGGGGQKLIKYNDRYYVANLWVEPSYAEKHMNFKSVEGMREKYEPRLGKITSLIIMYTTNDPKKKTDWRGLCKFVDKKTQREIEQ